MPNKSKTAKKRRAAGLDKMRKVMSEKRREKMRGEMREQQVYYQHIQESFEEADQEFEEMKKESAQRSAKSFKTTILVVLALCLAEFVWSRVDASRYTEVGATITGYRNVQRQQPIFDTYTTQGGVFPYYETWVTVEYTYNDIEYKGSVKLDKNVQSQHIMVYCKKNHPQECRLTKLKYPKLDTGIMIIFGIVLVIGLCV